MPFVAASSPADLTAFAGARAGERSVVLGYVPAHRRIAVQALLALDDVLAGIVRTTREPIVGQMRLTWWYEALEALDDKMPPVGEPVLGALAGTVLPLGISGRYMATMIDAWEALLSPDPMDAPGLQQFAAGRGGTLFAAMAQVLGGDSPPLTSRAGEGWALADLAGHWREPGTAALARTMATACFEGVFGTPWPRPIRPLGMLALLARDDLSSRSPRPGSPGRLGRLLMHRIWGR